MSSYKLAIYVDRGIIQFVFFSENKEGRLHANVTPSILSFFRFSCDCDFTKYNCEEHCNKYTYHETLADFEDHQQVSFPWAYEVKFFFHADGELINKFQFIAKYDSKQLIEPEAGSVTCHEVKTFFKMEEFEAYLTDHGCNEARSSYYHEKDHFTKTEEAKFTKPGRNTPSSSEEEEDEMLDEVILNWEPFTRFKRSRSPLSELDMLEEEEAPQKKVRFLPMD